MYRSKELKCLFKIKTGLMEVYFFSSAINGLNARKSGPLSKSLGLIISQFTLIFKLKTEIGIHFWYIMR